MDSKPLFSPLVIIGLIHIPCVQKADILEIPSPDTQAVSMGELEKDIGLAPCSNQAKTSTLSQVRTYHVMPFHFRFRFRR
jgi:hypothetical protein